jgi:hypothetical protein
MILAFISLGAYSAGLTVLRKQQSSQEEEEEEEAFISRYDFF